MKSNLPPCTHRRLRWFFASGTRLIALLLLAIGLPGVIPGQLGTVFPFGLVRFHTAISAELVGMALAVLLIDTANELRSEREQKEALILQMGSDNNSLAREAIRILRLRGWLKDGTLRGAKLLHADLQGAPLASADLQEAVIEYTNLREANLTDVSLRAATLVLANLEGASMNRTSLYKALLFHTSLKGARWVTCDQLRQATILHVTMPDGRTLPESKPGESLFDGIEVRAVHADDQVQLIPRRIVLAGGERMSIDDFARPFFEAWCETVELDENGYIVPAPLED